MKSCTVLLFLLCVPFVMTQSQKCLIGRGSEIQCVTREKKPERGHDGLKPVTAKCCRALLPSEEVDVNYMPRSTILRITHLLFKTDMVSRYSVNSYNRILAT
ncbi:PREDICTED: uncharacterized protein LOC108783047 isoform X1 [Cyphomyrmex costatus]|uniref:uncharacterized protein LOC108783047 isoform X1 n=1 Tax=Cyphomyrmex costatus TaxID=456900 RepID=UPI0008522BFA|nr:PREDICTED: uncharacterized protein LOC108783047 isoform X1 [Cyphomyrmex costatus]